MDNKRLAELLFPASELSSADIADMFPPRRLEKGAMVTRIAPSPTGFVHFGNLFPAIVSERLARQSGGVFYLRIEDTDHKRALEGAEEVIINAFKQYNIIFDEGAVITGDDGCYGPYRQSRRAHIYHAFAKELVVAGKAYPCFCTEEELSDARGRQEAEKANFGYFGEWAVHRDFSLEQIEAALSDGKRYVLRLRSWGSLEKKISHKDLVKGGMELPENDVDHVLLKSDGIPTYHFAHVVDDHLMGTTHVVRGDEWLSTLPLHLQLFDALGWKPPHYLHISPLMKQDGDSRRKLSKRKDPETALLYYKSEGFPAESVYEYILTLLNSSYEEWRAKNPASPIGDFPFSIQKMSVSGALFDLTKLKDVSKNAIARMDAAQAYQGAAQWAEEFDDEFYELLTRDRDYSAAILAIGRGAAKPRKDIAMWSEVRGYMDFFFDELFEPQYIFPENVDETDVAAILSEYGALYDPRDDNAAWFDKIRHLSERLGFSPDVKAYKKNPDAFKGHVGDVSMIIRIAICGRTNSPDMCECMRLLGAERVRARLRVCLGTVALEKD